MFYQLESPDINTVINYCKDLCANDKIEVYDFGGKKDLVLHIYKDEDFDQKTKAYNLVTISTFRNGKAVDESVRYRRQQDISSFMRLLTKKWKRSAKRMILYFWKMEVYFQSNKN